MLSFFLWYLFISLLGLLAFPAVYKLLPALADRGYTLTRAAGLLLWSYMFWLLGSLGLLRNDFASQIFALLLLGGIGYAAFRSISWVELRGWLRDQRKLILIVEVLFFAAFGALAIVRAANPEIVGTEKPMELAFINAILRSPTLPPYDPWLSGYSIAYYHFGYIIIAMLARMTATSGGIAFNLGIALVFGLAAIGSYGVLFNLTTRKREGTRAGREAEADEYRRPVSYFAPMLAPFFVLIVSNLSGLLHLMRINGVFWRQSETGEWISPFWSWLDIGSLSNPPPETNFPHWWWWQGSRIVQDYDYLWQNKGDIIGEFPFFSFLLADLHPHVLAMPFSFLAIAVALNMFLAGGKGQIRWLGIRLHINWLTFVFAAFVIGAFGFLNTWDFPFYAAIFAGAYVLRRLCDTENKDQEPSLVGVLKDFFGMGLAIGVTGGILYLPFYLGFSSQAGGLIPNLLYVTKGVYGWIQFAPLLVPIFGLVIFLGRRYGSRTRMIAGIKATFLLTAILATATAVLLLLISMLYLLAGVNPDAGIAGDLFLSTLQAPGWREAVQEGLIRRFTIPGMLLTLTVLLVFVLALLWPDRSKPDTKSKNMNVPAEAVYVLLLTLVGTLLVLGPEFLFLRDFFGYRINTIFKFYFLAWLLWSVAAAYGSILLWTRLTGMRGYVFRGILVVVLGAAMLYPVMGLWSKTNGFKPATWSLDGTDHIERYNPDEAAAIDWLKAAPLGVLAESIGGSFSGHARFSSHSGQPTVLGWVGHEHQWRGGFEEMGSREGDIQVLYCTPRWEDAQMIAQKYGITYVVIGNQERATYVAGSSNCPSGLSEGKFGQYAGRPFQQGNVTIYQMP